MLRHMTVSALRHRRCIAEIDFFECGGNHDFDTLNLKFKPRLTQAGISAGGMNRRDNKKRSSVCYG